MIFFMLLLSFFVALSAADPPEYSGAAITCPKGAHIIVVRGSLEPQGPGIMGEVAEKVLKLLPDSDMESLVYPALYDPYIESQTEGVRAMTALVNNYAKSCPKTDLIIMGFSQGAHVTMDVMCGASSDGFPATLPQPSYITDKVASIILMGDPSLTEGQSFHVGSSHGSGIFPRKLPVGCDSISDKTISICDAGDPFCEAGGKQLSVHMGYVKVWGEYMVNHVTSLFR
ncbi:hypothetical protein NW762_000010 [Fusarium torreyae]|uniref:Acetylxylan esterase n=1 Tax=Fusarium torreyae TaxID=1237075 RepID=A0A9W8VL87_9HYPO|nr:hypothetical protein NW762_000010 [Fusarium torreyae]